MKKENMQPIDKYMCSEICTCSTLLVKCTLEWNGNPPDWSDSPWASIDFKLTTVIQFTLIWEITMTTCIDKTRWNLVMIYYSNDYIKINWYLQQQILALSYWKNILLHKVYDGSIMIWLLCYCTNRHIHTQQNKGKKECQNNLWYRDSIDGKHSSIRMFKTI